jgi:hypothetical protein
MANSSLSEYGVNILDLLRSLPSRIVITEPLPGHDNGAAKDNTIVEKMAEDYLVRHVVPEALVEVKKEILQSVKEIIVQDKIRTLTIPSDSANNAMLRQSFEINSFSDSR